MENVIIYLIIFLIGTLFGSFSTLAVHRIPLHQDITHKRSYCPKCNHKLGFWDMIPILSYIALGGKCRYCKNKIRIRYLMLEILTGTVFLLFAISINIQIYNISKIIYLMVGILYISGLIIIAGIDKENIKVSKPVLVYEITILSAYMIYLYILESINIYRYVIYLLILLALFIIDTVNLKKSKKENYTIQIIILCIIQAIFTYGYGFMMTATITLLSIAITCIIRKMLKKEEQFSKKMPIAYYLCFANIITIIFINTIACRR